MTFSELKAEVPERPGPGHRKLGLVVSIEAGERASYIALLATVGLYVTTPATQGGLGLTPVIGTAVVGSYGAGLYLASLLGGWVADRILGPTRTLLAGALLIPLGLVILAAVPTMTGLGAGLLVLATGAGAVKATTGLVVAGLYKDDHKRRTRAFTVYYSVINGGVALGGLAGMFASTSVPSFRVILVVGAVLSSACVTVFGIRLREQLAHDRPAHAVSRASAMLVLGALASVVGLSSVALFSGYARVADLTVFMALGCATAAASILWRILRSQRISAAQRHNVRRYLIVFAASTIHVALWTHIFTVVTLYAATSPLGGSASLALQIGITAGPVAAVTAAYLMSKRRLPRSSNPALAYARAWPLMALGFGALSITPYLAPHALVWTLAAMVPLFFIADFLAAPVALSFTTAIAPQLFGGQMLAVHYVSFALGSALSGLSAEPYRIMGPSVFFALLAAVGIVGAIVLTAIRNRLDSPALS